MHRRRDDILRDLARCLLVLLIQAAALVQTSSADSLRMLDDDTDALRARLELVDSAGRRIDCACFELRADDITYGFLAHLQSAARRGVEVRLLVDAYGNQIDSVVLHETAGSGVQIRRFHPFQLHNAHRYTRRMHDKLLIADQETVILGGRNLGAAYFGRAPEGNFVDFDIEIAGDASICAGAYFEQLWASDAVVPLCCNCQSGNRQPGRARSQFDSPVGIPHTTPAGLLLRGMLNLDADIAHSPPSAPIGQTFDVAPAGVQFLHSRRGVADGSQDITDAIAALIDASRREVTIETPYLVLTGRFEQSLRAAVRRGVSVRLLGNSLASIDKPVAHAGYVNQKRLMLQMGVELWEYQSPDMLHAKSMLIDDCAVVGSYDLHPRSQHYDTETAVLIRDAGVAAAIRESMERHFSQAVRVDRSPGYRQSRAISGAPPRLRILQMQLLRLPALFLKKHL